jgi:hypothetical protein
LKFWSDLFREGVRKGRYVKITLLVLCKPKNGDIVLMFSGINYQFFNFKIMENKISILPKSDQKSDKDLHNEFCYLGKSRQRLTNELLLLIPEIYEREIYKRYAATIIEYAGRFGGLSKGVVMKSLKMEKYLYNKPKMRAAIGLVGINKVAMVANLATPENEGLWVEKLKNMSKSAIQELCKEVRNKQINSGNFMSWKAVERVNAEENFAGSLFENGDKMAEGSANVAFIDFGKCCAAGQKITIELDDEMYTKFLMLKNKWGEFLSHKELMRRMLDRLLEEEKEKKCAKR